MLTWAGTPPYPPVDRFDGTSLGTGEATQSSAEARCARVTTSPLREVVDVDGSASPDEVADDAIDHARWNREHRGENDVQRVDRNFLELLQEVRVAQTGVQILFAFLLGFAFTPRFASLTTAQHAVYLVTLVSAALAAGFLIAPVSYHRMVFRRRLKSHVVESGHRSVAAGLAFLLLTLIGGVDLAATFVVDGWGNLLAVLLGLGIAWLWWGQPLLHRRQHLSEE